MRLAPECRACLLSRVVAEATHAGAAADTVSAALERCTELYDSRADEPIGASVIAGAVHRCCYAVIGSKDPYADLKVQDNAIAEKVVQDVQPMLSNVHDHIVAAVIGNAMDYGVAGHEIAKDFTG